MKKVQKQLRRFFKQPQTSIEFLVDALLVEATSDNIHEVYSEVIATASSLINQKRYEEALALLAVIDEKKSDDWTVLTLVADALTNTHDYESAMDIAQKISSIAVTLIQQIQAMHLILGIQSKFISNGCQKNGTVAYDNLLHRMSRIVLEKPRLNLRDAATLYGATFWLAGYWQDSAEVRVLQQDISVYVQGEIAREIGQ